MFEKVKVKAKGKPLKLSSNSDVDSAEKKLKVQFPSGYREYVTKFGDGILGGSYIRIYPPKEIVSELKEWRSRIKEYWFWDDGVKVLPKKKVYESIIIGDTLDGDELIVHPSNPERIYVLPRNEEMIYVAGDGLPAAIEWLCSSGTLTEAFKERNFELFPDEDEEDDE